MHSVTRECILKLPICKCELSVLAEHGYCPLSDSESGECSGAGCVAHCNGKDIRVATVFLHQCINWSRGDIERGLHSITNARRIQYGREGRYLRIDGSHTLCQSRIIENAVFSERRRKLMHEVHNSFRTVD